MKLKKRRCDNERHTKSSRRIFLVSRIKSIDVIQVIRHVINRLKSYEIIEIDEKIATTQRRRTIKKRHFENQKQRRVNANFRKF